MSMKFLLSTTDLITEIDDALLVVAECIRDHKRIRELGGVRNALYKETREGHDGITPEAMKHLEERLQPSCEEIDDIYERKFPPSIRCVEALLGRISTTLATCPIRPPELRELRDECERSNLFKRFRSMEWTGVESDLLIIKGRLEEMAACLSGADNPAAAPDAVSRTGATQPKRRGRRPKYPDARKLEALRAKRAGRSNKEAAKIIYDATYPTSQQIKNVHSILAHYTKTHPEVQ